MHNTSTFDFKYNYFAVLVFNRKLVFYIRELCNLIVIG